MLCIYKSLVFDNKTTNKNEYLSGLNLDVFYTYKNQLFLYLGGRF